MFDTTVWEAVEYAEKYLNERGVKDFITQRELMETYLTDMEFSSIDYEYDLKNLELGFEFESDDDLSIRVEDDGSVSLFISCSVDYDLEALEDGNNSHIIGGKKTYWLIEINANKDGWNGIKSILTTG